MIFAVSLSQLLTHISYNSEECIVGVKLSYN